MIQNHRVAPSNGKKVGKKFERFFSISGFHWMVKVEKEERRQRVAEEHTVEPFVTAASGLGGALERLLCWSLMSPGGQYSTLHHYNIAAICSLWLHRL